MVFYILVKRPAVELKLIVNQGRSLYVIELCAKHTNTHITHLYNTNHANTTRNQHNYPNTHRCSKCTSSAALVQFMAICQFTPNFLTFDRKLNASIDIVVGSPSGLPIDVCEQVCGTSHWHDGLRL